LKNKKTCDRFNNKFLLLYLFFRALDRNEYNHITATYFLLAERKLRLQQQQQQQHSTQKSNIRKKPDLSLHLVSPTTASR
jgi:SNF related kinase